MQIPKSAIIIKSDLFIYCIFISIKKNKLKATLLKFRKQKLKGVNDFVMELKGQMYQQTKLAIVVGIVPLLFFNSTITPERKQMTYFLELLITCFPEDLCR